MKTYVHTYIVLPHTPPTDAYMYVPIVSEKKTLKPAPASSLLRLSTSGPRQMGSVVLPPPLLFSSLLSEGLSFGVRGPSSSSDSSRGGIRGSESLPLSPLPHTSPRPGKDRGEGEKAEPRDGKSEGEMSSDQRGKGGGMR